MDSKVHDDYILERYKEGTTATGRGGMSRTQNSIYRNLSSTRKVFLRMSNLLEKLEKSILYYRFIEDRRIPNDNDIYLVNQFYSWTNNLVPNKFPTLDGDHPRMVIPFRDSNGDIFAYQGRAFGKKNQSTLPSFLMRVYQKYLDLIGLTLLGIFLSWKPIDSLFIQNCIAVVKVICVYLNTKTKQFLFQITNQGTNK